MAETDQLNILQVLRAPTGGLWRHVVDLSEELAHRGHRLGLVCDADFNDAQTEKGLARLSPLLAHGVHRFPIAREPGVSDLSKVMRIRQLAASLGADIVHGHGAKGGLLARAAAFGARGRASVYTPHGGVLNYNPTSLKGRIFRLVERGMAPITDAMVFESAYAQDAFTRQMCRPRKLHAVVHNGLRPDEFSPASGPHDFDFAFVGELRQIKGVDVLLDAMADVHAPDGRPATLVLAGGGPAEADIRAQIARLGLENRVELVGVQPAREIFGRGRCVVIPSRSESLPYVVLEAVAAGCPVLTTRVGGIAEIFGPTEDELLAAGDVAALGSTLQAFMDDEGAFSPGTAARLEHVRAGFSIATMTDGIEAIYRQAKG